MIQEYMSMRKEIWSGLAARIEEDWRVVEEKVGPSHIYASAYLYRLILSDFHKLYC